MPQSLMEYADALAERNLLWPKPPGRELVPATPFLKPLPNIRVVLWDIYGTLLRVSDGDLILMHPQQVRMEVALDKTIQEFNMWHSMSRKPGAPWEYMLQLFSRAHDDLRLAGSGRKGDLTEVDAAKIWRRVLDSLNSEEFKYDRNAMGDLDELSEKIAYFYHSALQGLEPADGARDALLALNQAGLRQGILADAQCFTMTQLLRGLKSQGTLPPLGQLLNSELITLSYQFGSRKPSRSLYALALGRCQSFGVQPAQVLYVSAHLPDDLAIARSFGCRTALYAGDKVSMRASVADLRDPAVKPDRLMTDLLQIREILGV